MSFKKNVMKQKTAILFALFIVTLTGCAIDEPTEQISPMTLSPSPNTEAIAKADKPLPEAESGASRLWLHVRNAQQQQLTESLGEKLKPDNNIIIEPVQLVETGPKRTQLRFFTLQDKERAKELLKKFKKIFPKLELLDLSAEYGGRMASGHFELWLAPDVKKINLPLPEVAPLTPPASALLPLSKP